MRYLTITVKEQKEDIQDQYPRTVEQVLQKQCGFTKRQIRQAKFRPEGILKNGQRCRVTERAVPGDLIQVCLEEEREISSHLKENAVPPEILYEDEDLLAVNKPAGLVTHPQGGHYQDTLANQIAAYFREKGEEHGIRPVGRLDRETSGIVVFAKSQMAAARLQEQRERGIFQKTYLAAAQGEMEMDGTEHRICRPMAPDPSNRLKMCVAENGKYACTHYRVLNTVNGKSLLEVRLDTGRTHQIRVHMASLGHPLAGDQLYGIKEQEESKPEAAVQERNSDRAALHAWKVELHQPFTGEQIQIEASIPEDFMVYNLFETK